MEIGINAALAGAASYRHDRRLIGASSLLLTNACNSYFFGYTRIASSLYGGFCGTAEP